MYSMSKQHRQFAVKALVLGVALAPFSLYAQTNAPTDPPAVTQDQQGPPPPEHGGHGDPAARDAHMLKMMTKRLDLTPDQVTQIQGIQSDTRTQMQGLRSDTSVAGPDRHAKMMQIHQAQTEKVRAVLNDQQKTKFDAMEQRRQEHRGERGEGAPPPPAPQQ